MDLNASYSQYTVLRIQNGLILIVSQKNVKKDIILINMETVSHCHKNVYHQLSGMGKNAQYHIIGVLQGPIKVVKGVSLLNHVKKDLFGIKII